MYSKAFFIITLDTNPICVCKGHKDHLSLLKLNYLVFFSVWGIM